MTKGDVIPNADTTSQGEDESQGRESSPLDVNIAMTCVLKGSLQRFIQCFEEEDSPYKDLVQDSMNAKDSNGKTALDMAAILGRAEMMKELITRGAEVNNGTSSGYSAIHHAACWGKIACLKALVENGADIHGKTTNGERPREIAVRYNQAECVDFLDWAEAKQNILDAILSIREMMADPEKIQGKLDRTDKSMVTTLCNEKSDWAENTSDATTHDFITQKQALDDAMEPIWAKLNEPAPEKK